MTEQTKSITVLGKSPVLEETKSCPEQTIWKYFIHPSGNMTVGIWDCTAGKWEGLIRPCPEFCYILEGSAIVTEEGGVTHEFKKGDSFVSPTGVKTTWEVKKYVKKIYVSVTGLDE